MKSIKYLLAAFVVSAMFASCAKEEMTIAPENEIVGAELLGTNISVNFGKGVDTKVAADATWEDTDRLGFGWLGATPGNNLKLNHMFQKDGKNVYPTTKGNIYAGWHFGYYPFVYHANPDTQLAVDLNPTQTEPGDIAELYTSGLWLSTRKNLTASDLNMETYQLKTKFDMFQVSKAMLFAVKPDDIIKADPILKELPIQSITINTPNTNIFVKNNEGSDVTISPANLAEMVFDEGEYDFVNTQKNFYSSVASALTYDWVPEVTVLVDNDEMNLSADQALRVNTLPRAITMDEANMKKSTIIINVDGGYFKVQYIDKPAAQLSEYEATNNEVFKNIRKAFMTDGVLSSFKLSSAGQHRPAIGLILDLNHTLFTPDFTTIDDIEEWNRAVAIADALDMPKEKTIFTVTGEICITEGAVLNTPKNGFTVNTKGKGKICVESDYTMPSALAVALSAADVVVVNEDVTLTVGNNITLDAKVDNDGTIKAGYKATVKTVNNEHGRIEVVYGSYVEVETGKDGVIAYDIIANETAVRVNNLINGGTNGKYAHVNTLAIKDGVVLDMLMENSSTSEDDPYEDTTTDYETLTNLSGIDIEMYGGTLKGDKALNKFVKNIYVKAGNNNINDVLVKEDLVIDEGTSASVDVSELNHGDLVYKKDVTVGETLHVNGSLTTNANIIVDILDNEHGNIVVNAGYVISWITDYFQGGSVKGTILQVKSPDPSTVANVTTLAELKAAIANEDIQIIVATNANILTGTIDLKGKTLTRDAGKFEIAAKTTIKNGTVACEVDVTAAGDATFENVTFTVDEIVSGNEAVYVDGKASFKNCILFVAGRPIHTSGSSTVTVDGCLIKARATTGGNYFNLSAVGKLVLTNNTFEIGFSCDFAGFESKCTINGNTFEKTISFTAPVGVVTASDLAPATKTFVNNLLDNNTFKGSEKVHAWVAPYDTFISINEKI